MQDSTQSTSESSDVKGLEPGDIALVELQPELVVCYDTFGLLLGRFCGPLELAEKLRGELRSGVTYIVRPSGGRARAYTVESLGEALGLLQDIADAGKNKGSPETKGAPEKTLF